MSLTKVVITLSLAALTFGCSESPKISETPVANTSDQSKRVAETVASHTTEGKIKKTPQPPESDLPAANTGVKKKWSRSGDPIDTSKYDAAVRSAQSTLKAKPEDPTAKKALGTAYFERGVALTGARQYASAIGDFRKALKHDPSNDEATKQISTITAIYASMNIESPAEGEEPPPLELKKEKD